MRGTAFSSRGRSSRGDEVGSTMTVGAESVGGVVGCGVGATKLHANVARIKTDTDKISFFDMVFPL
jgi:hypothetical protein